MVNADMEDGDTTSSAVDQSRPASSRNCIAGWLGDTLKVRVTAQARAREGQRRS